MTKLQAVNVCLSAMGEPKINSLDDAAIDAQMAIDIVDETTLSVQTTGWHWNTEKHTLSPSTDGYIYVPENTIAVDTIESDYGVDVVQRGLRLFNRETSSFIFNKPLTVSLIVCLDYDDVPMAAKQFISIRAARIFQQRALGSDTLYKFDGADETRAWAVLMQAEAESQDANVLRDNWSTASIMNRSHFSRGSY